MLMLMLQKTPNSHDIHYVMLVGHPKAVAMLMLMLLLMSMLMLMRYEFKRGAGHEVRVLHLSSRGARVTRCASYI